EGWQQWAQDRVSQDPSLLRELLPLLDSSVQAIEFPRPAALPAGDGEDAEDDEDSGARGREEPDTEDDAEDNEGSRPVAASVRGDAEAPIVELLARRALEIAGKRRVRSGDGAQQARLRGIPTHERHRYMGAVAEGEVARL